MIILLRYFFKPHTFQIFTVKLIVSRSRSVYISDPKRRRFNFVSFPTANLRVYGCHLRRDNIRLLLLLLYKIDHHIYHKKSTKNLVNKCQNI